MQTRYHSSACIANCNDKNFILFHLDSEGMAIKVENSVFTKPRTAIWLYRWSIGILPPFMQDFDIHLKSKTIKLVLQKVKWYSVPWLISIGIVPLFFFLGNICLPMLYLLMFCTRFSFYDYGHSNVCSPLRQNSIY